MKKEQVLIDSEKMTEDMILEEKNVDCRRELLRKFGVERMANHGKEKDTSKGYRLIDMSYFFPNIDYAPYLFMENPSLPGTFHMEAVGPECTTIEHACNWRHSKNINKKWSPEIIT